MAFGPFNADKPKNNYEIIGADVTKVILAFVDRIAPFEACSEDIANVVCDYEASGVAAAHDEASSSDIQASLVQDASITSIAVVPAADMENRILATFRTWDTNGDGFISKDELVRALETIGDGTNDIHALFDAADADKDGSIHYEEFLRWIYESAPSSVKQAAEGSATVLPGVLSGEAEPDPDGAAPISVVAQNPVAKAKAKGKAKAASAGRLRKNRRIVNNQRPQQVQWGFDVNGPAPAEVDPEGHGVTDAAGELRTIQTRGGDVVVQVMGPEGGRPAIVLHGWGRCSWSRDLQYLFAPLAEAGYKVIAPDFPGFGRSQGKRWCSRSETNYQTGGPIEILEDVLTACGVAWQVGCSHPGWCNRFWLQISFGFLVSEQFSRLLIGLLTPLESLAALHPHLPSTHDQLRSPSSTRASRHANEGMQ